MKKLKTLLPLAGIASVAAIVTPIAVSCGNGSSFSSLGELDTSKWTRSPDTRLATKEAIEQYYEAVEKDSRILYNDFVFGKHYLANLIQTSAIFSPFSSSYGNVGANQQSLTQFADLIEFDTDVPTLSLSKSNGLHCMNVIFNTRAALEFNNEVLWLLLSSYGYGTSANAASSMESIITRYDIKEFMSIDVDMASVPYTIYTDLGGDASTLFPHTSIMPINPDDLDQSKLADDFHIALALDIKIQIYDKDTHEMVWESASEGSTSDIWITGKHMEYYMDKNTIIIWSDNAADSTGAYSVMLGWPTYYYSSTIVEEPTI